MPYSDAQGPILVKQTAQGIIEIGQRLIEVKERLGHGGFLPWLKSEFDMAERTAYNFMKVAEKFKLANFANLDFAPSALYLLASSSDDSRQEALTLAESGEKVTHAKAQGIPHHSGGRCSLQWRKM